MPTIICGYCDYVGSGKYYNDKIADVESHEKTCPFAQEDLKEQAKQLAREGICDACSAVGCNNEDICDGFKEDVETTLKEWADE